MNSILLVHGPQLSSDRKEIIAALVSELSKEGYNLTVAENLHFAMQNLKANPRISCLILDWDCENLKAFADLAAYNPEIPIFALGDQEQKINLVLEDFNLNLYFYQYNTDLVQDGVKRIMRAMKEYFDFILPPFTKQLMEYTGKLNYSFCTPGHQQGDGFQKTPVGVAFYDFYGPNIFKTDLSVSMVEMGSLLDHTGPYLEAEKFISETFRSDRSLVVTNGTSTANKIVGMYVASAGDTVLVDRNCHKSVTHFMMMTNVNPVYLKPRRNAYGIIGGIPLEEFSRSSIQKKLDEHSVIKKWPTYAVITNSTYDGIFYNVEKINKILDVEHLHFDSAWTAYTSFHPIYNHKYGMSITPKEGQTIYETQSTHKLLNAFSQASMIHIKGRFCQERLNEAFMMHTTTSPFYPIVASCEVSAAMMTGEVGRSLMDSCIDEAVAFRHEIIKLKKESNNWYYDIWQPSNLKKVEAWPIREGEKWHGFSQQDDDYLYLDPIKITVLLPGIKAGKLEQKGIPAAIVGAYLEDHGIIVEKTGPYSLLFLFGIGVNKAKAMQLLSVLNKFKQVYDANLPVKQVLFSIYKDHPEFYADKTIQEITQIQHKLMVKHDLPNLLGHAFDTFPDYVMNPYQAYQKFIKGKTKKILLENMENKISAVMVLPYPPGIPLIMPGEKITEKTRLIVDFLLTLIDIGKHLPGFETEIHGLKLEENNYTIRVIDEGE